jgi:hypothetical protein
MKHRLTFTRHEITDLLIGLSLSRDQFYGPDKTKMSPVRAAIIALGRRDCETLIKRLRKVLDRETDPAL